MVVGTIHAATGYLTISGRVTWVALIPVGLAEIGAGDTGRTDAVLGCRFPTTLRAVTHSMGVFSRLTEVQRTAWFPKPFQTLQHWCNNHRGTRRILAYVLGLTFGELAIAIVERVLRAVGQCARGLPITPHRHCRRMSSRICVRAICHCANWIRYRGPCRILRYLRRYPQGQRLGLLPLPGC